ncbi:MULTISPECIES: hypothetical protein [Deinococcus]|uniref:Uncharacterized protein n=2 Tax=Deinococcus soli (ex Cha et al. 2016) TaxID=1309411 RepID=A0ACC6KNP5_9DEIO|nr:MULTISPECIES: hypothetical protein [Deinococcus]MCD0161213.1 hypothetical protein [Deinococcus sp. 6YEL10]MCD0164058.1 hypothetical protein [Deinococcus sp. 12RED42]MDK2013717.1 hypothetical protein [Deinococcus sp. 43]MDR6221025.1 hypothetical protein [Deinococcus soli (ex Cha et al. 2016)]MDR6331379.1 hypothetical protein [Deinococcus soli (ex Cha et al. 2016)]
MTNKRETDHTAADAAQTSPAPAGMPRWVKGFLWVGVALLLAVLARFWQLNLSDAGVAQQVA